MTSGIPVDVCLIVSSIGSGGSCLSLFTLLFVTIQFRFCSSIVVPVLASHEPFWLILIGDF